VCVQDREVILNNKEYQLLSFLTENSGMVLSREKILERIWGYDSESDIRTIDVHIKMLRDRLGPGGAYIRTVRGNGYLFEVADEEHTH
jgi:DNA-binding response OmpR family regulator